MLNFLACLIELVTHSTPVLKESLSAGLQLYSGIGSLMFLGKEFASVNDLTLHGLVEGWEHLFADFWRDLCASLAIGLLLELERVGSH